MISKDIKYINIIRLYILGGYDIREGAMDSLWMLDLNKVSKSDDESIEIN